MKAGERRELRSEAESSPDPSRPSGVVRTRSKGAGLGPPAPNETAHDFATPRDTARDPRALMETTHGPLSRKELTLAALEAPVVPATSATPAASGRRCPPGPAPEWSTDGAPTPPRCAACRWETSAQVRRCPWPAAADRRPPCWPSSVGRGRGGRRRRRAESADARGASSALCAARACWAPGAGLLKDRVHAAARPGQAFRHSGEREGPAQGHAHRRGSRPNGGGPET